MMHTFHIGQELTWKYNNNTYKVVEIDKDIVRLQDNEGHGIAIIPELTDMSVFITPTYVVENEHLPQDSNVVFGGTKEECQDFIENHNAYDYMHVSRLK